MLLYILIKEGVGKGSRLWEAMNAITNFKVDPAVDMDIFHDLILVGKVLWDVAQFDAGVLRSV